MIEVLRDRIDSFFGRGKFGTAVPVMDGPLQPNHLLETAPVLASEPGLDNAIRVGDALFVSSGPALLRIDDGSLKSIATFPATITCLAGDGRDAIAVGLDGIGVSIRGGRHDGRIIKTLGVRPLICATAALYLDPDTLLVACGSAFYAASQWKRDLMGRGTSGSVWRINLITGTVEELADQLAFPFGLAIARDGGLLVSEAWRHRIVLLDCKVGASPVPVLEDLPGYPARLVPAAHGGYWLALFAPRNQLIEFVIQERAYCDKMMSGVEPDFWIAPMLCSGVSFREPRQASAIKQMGILKPWASTFSYGLVVLLDADLQPKASWHSRADGSNHGVTSLCEHEDHLVVTAKGPGRALRININLENSGVLR
jgi:hypothetical protein